VSEYQPFAYDLPYSACRNVLLTQLLLSTCPRYVHSANPPSIQSPFVLIELCVCVRILLEVHAQQSISVTCALSPMRTGISGCVIGPFAVCLYVYVYVYLYVYVFVYVYVYVFVFVFVYVSVYVYMYVSVFVSVSVSVSVSVYVHVCPLKLGCFVSYWKIVLLHLVIVTVIYTQHRNIPPDAHAHSHIPHKQTATKTHTYVYYRTNS